MIFLKSRHCPILIALYPAISPFTIIASGLTDRITSDIYIKSKELHFNTEEMRIVFLIKFYGKTDMMPFEMLQNMFPDKSKDYVISVGEHDIVLVKEVRPTTDIREIEKIATNIADTLSTEFYTKVAIGISTVVDNIKDLARAYKEAQVALEVGKVFETEKNIISYENLGIGRLIYQLPTTLCEMFLRQSAHGNRPEGPAALYRHRRRRTPRRIFHRRERAAGAAAVHR